MPIGRPITTPVGNFSHHYAVVATVETADGEGSFYGWTLSEREAMALREMIGHVGACLIGRDAGEIGANLARMQGALRLTGRTGIGCFAMGVLDACLWDLKGKAAGMPIWQLLGGSGSAPVPAYASSLFLSSTIEELRTEAREFRDAGFKWVKMRVGKPTVEEDLLRIDAVRSILGDHINLMMDAVMLWDVRTALDRICAYERFNPFWVEDPVDYHEGQQVAALARVRAESPVRIAAGEFQFGVEPFREMIRTHAVDLPMVDLQHVGGLSPWLDVVAMARLEGITVVPHVFPEMAIHVHCIDRSPLPIECVPWTTELFSDDFQPHEGSFQAPTAPGVGLTMSWKRLAEWTLGAPTLVSG